MNTEFIQGKYYRLRKDYPITDKLRNINNNILGHQYSETIMFERHNITWIEGKAKVIDFKPRLCLESSKYRPILADTMPDGSARDWAFTPEAFEECNDIDNLVRDWNIIIGESNDREV